MLRNDSLPITVVVTVIELVVLAVNSFLVYVIWKYSPKTIGIFKSYMLRMAVSFLSIGLCLQVIDFVFSLSFGWVCQPVPMLPLPGLVTAGPVQYLGMVGSKIAFIVTLCSAVLSLNFVNECCLYRTLLFYKLHGWLEFYTTCP